MTQSRRDFIKAAGAVSLGFAGLHRYVDLFGARPLDAAEIPFGYGDLLPDPEGLVDLPKGFTYQVISRTGEQMDDGFFVPTAHDGMAAFKGPRGKTILVRNHELNVSGSDREDGPFGPGLSVRKKLPAKMAYDNGKGERHCAGGTTTLVYDTKKRQLERHYLSLAGTLRNCAGGPTPWGSWVTCEETTERAGVNTQKDHGYNFEVPARDKIGLADPIPLKAMGRFNHEAIAVDPKSGIVYETEDAGDSLIYRYIPNKRGKLAQGGRLQALVVRDQPRLDTRNWEQKLVTPGMKMAVSWVDIENVESPGNDLRHQGWGKGAARFARGEGMWYGRNAIFFACTNGGKGKHGQVFRYVPSPEEGKPGEAKKPGTLELFVEPDDKNLVDMADNLTVSPWGDLIMCEDGSGVDFLVGVTPKGEIYKFGRNALNQGEFAGATFAPDGSTFFVNIQNPGLTLAIRGPWRKG